MEKKIEYVRCPRCELNYIDKREKLCKVCQAELSAKGSREISDEEAKELNLCPHCKKNYLMDDEEICSECQSEQSILDFDGEIGGSTDDQIDDREDRSENWRQYVENDDAEVEEDEFGDDTSITTGDDADDMLDDLDFDDKDGFDDADDSDEADDLDDFDDDFDDMDDDVADDDDYDDDEDDDQ